MSRYERNLLEKAGVGSREPCDTLSSSEGVIEAFDCNIYAFDPAPKSTEYVKNIVYIIVPNFIFSHMP